MTGKGERADLSASRTLRAPWIPERELVSASLAVLVWPGWSIGFLRLSGSGFGGAVVARGASVCTGVSVSEATVCGCRGSCLTGGFGAGFLMLTEGEGTGEDAARGDTGGLALAFIAASLGEFLRFGGIGVPDFAALAQSGLEGGVVIFSSSSGALLPLCSTNGAILASMAEVKMRGSGGAVLYSGVGAGARMGVGEGSLARVDRLQVRVVVSLEGLS